MDHQTEYGECEKCGKEAHLYPFDDNNKFDPTIWMLCGACHPKRTYRKGATITEIPVSTFGDPRYMER